MKRKPITALITIIIFLAIIICGFQFSDHEAEKLLHTMTTAVSNWFGNDAVESKDFGGFQAAKLVRVVDGDTIVVDISGEEAKVRLIGIDTPESVASSLYLDRTGKENTPEGERAADYVKNMLEDTETVYLQKDVSDTDRYGRLLRYVWLEIPKDDKDIEEISTMMLNGILVWEGIAEPAAYAPDTAHQQDFEYLADYRDMEIEQQMEPPHGEKE